MSRADFEAFLSDYNLTAEEAAAVRKVLDDRAHHSNGGGGFIGWGAALDVLSFVPVVGDIVDGARSIYYALHGDFDTAALFALGVVPLPGLSSSGLRGALKVVDRVAEAARKSGAKEAGREAGRLAMRGTAANYAAYEGTKQATGALFGDVDVDETVDYVLDDVLGSPMEDYLEEDLDPQLRALLADQFEESLNERLGSDSRVRLSEVNTVIARRVAEHNAFEAIFRRISPG